jgi:hypothetical protein
VDYRFGLIPRVVSVYTNSSVFQISLSAMLNYVAHILGTQILLFHSCLVFNRRMSQSTNCHFLIRSKIVIKVLCQPTETAIVFCRLISNFNEKKYKNERFLLRPEIMLLDFFQHQDLQMNHSCFSFPFWVKIWKVL